LGIQFGNMRENLRFVAMHFYIHYNHSMLYAGMLCLRPGNDIAGEIF